MTTEAYPPPAHTAPRGQCPSSPPLVRRPSPSAACHRPPPVHVSCALASAAASGLVLAGSGGSLLCPPDLVVRPRPPPVLVPACFVSVHRPCLRASFSPGLVRRLLLAAHPRPPPNLVPCAHPPAPLAPVLAAARSSPATPRVRVLRPPVLDASCLVLASPPSSIRNNGKSVCADVKLKLMKKNDHVPVCIV